MQRIYYGSITLDVADAVGQLVIALSTHARESQHYRFEAANGGAAPRAYAVGRTESVHLSAFVNGDEEADVVLVVGAGIPLAVAQISANGSRDPQGTQETIKRLTAQIAEYTSEED